MAELPDVFKADEHEKMQDFDVLPTKDILYLVEIVKSEVKKTKAGTGLRANFQLKVIESNDKDEPEKFKGRVIFVGLNIKNPNDEAVEISQRELRSMCDACAVEELEDTDELHEIAFGVKLGIEKSEGYPDKNTVKKYMTEEAYNKA